MMDWWSSTTNAAETSNFGPPTTLELQLDTTTTTTNGTPAPPTSSSTASPPKPPTQPPPPPPHSSFFDPWLNCDDLDLGAILQQHHQVNSNNHAFNEQLVAVSSSMEFNTAINHQTPAYQQQNCNQAAAARLQASDNKQQILSIINNSRHNNNNNEQHNNQQQQQQVHHRSNGLDPSSLGSSPINSLNSNYSLSPHSPIQFVTAQTTANQQQHSNRSLVLFSPIADQNSYNNNNACEVKPSVINQHSDLNNNNNQQQQSSYCFAQSNDYISEQKKEQLRYNQHQQQQQLQIAPTGRSSLGGHQRQCHKNTTNSASQAVGNSLLNGTNKLINGEPHRKQQAIRKQSNQSTSGGGGSLNKSGNVKLRRCRHITDYVLAEEEKRLLIKEGHSDFPMTCQARPLTKSEERILRKIRRKIRNKRSAQCSRQRKKEYVEDLERRYAEISRENEQLKQMISRMQQQQQQQQDCNNLQAQNQYQIEDLQQQQQQQQTNLQAPTNNTTFSDDDVCLEGGQSSNESVDMNWKDIFQPQSSSVSTARLAVAAAAAAAVAATSNQQQQTANVIYS